VYYSQKHQISILNSVQLLTQEYNNHLVIHHCLTKQWKYNRKCSKNKHIQRSHSIPGWPHLHSA